MKLGNWLLIVAIMAPAAYAQVAPAAGDAPVASEETTKGAAPERKRRLKFKGTGPSCVCANPVSESDIEAAMRAGAPPDAKTGSAADKQRESTPGRSEK
ncbi:MAG: hypothetical protein IPP91_06600 [Betaproteobacteria bacterium]|nr:hypothetical protein [Betaproteobacteria bacterium]